MTDKRFYDAKGPVTLADLAEKCGVKFRGNGAYIVEDVAPLAQAGPLDVTFFDPKRTDQDVSSIKAGVCVMSPEQAKQAPDFLNLLISEKTYRTFAAVGDYFYAFIDRDALVQTDAIDPSAQIGKNVTISPGAVIGANVIIGDESYIGANVTLGRGVTVGRNSVIHAGAAIAYSVLGDSVHVSPGAAIGQPGFGFMMDQGEPVDLPHLGRVLIGDNVRIGANTTIDRGSLGDTLIGCGSRIDNLVQIAHGVEIGAGCIIVAQVGIAGSARIGDFSAIGGQVGISDHITLGKGVRVVAQSGIMRDIEDGGTVGGTPALPIMEWRKQCVLLSQMVRARNAKRKSGESK